MIVAVDPLSGRPMLLPRPKALGGGGGSASGPSGFAMIGTSQPASGYEGQFFYNTSTSTLYVYANGVWTAISGGSSGGIASGASFPATPTNYLFFYNTTTHTLNAYLFDTWIPFINFKDIMMTDESGNNVVDQSGNPILETNTIDYIRS